MMGEVMCGCGYGYVINGMLQIQVWTACCNVDRIITVLYF